MILDEDYVKYLDQGIHELNYLLDAANARAEAAEAEVLALREVIGAVNNEFGSAAWNWPDPWRRVAQLKELSNDRWKRAEAAEAERDRLRAVLSDIKTASVCSVSRHVAASALGEAAA